MNVLIPLIVISLGILAAGALFLARGLKSGDYEHADHMAFLPLDEESRLPIEQSESDSAGKGGADE